MDNLFIVSLLSMIFGFSLFLDGDKIFKGDKNQKITTFLSFLLFFGGFLLMIISKFFDIWRS